VSLWILLNAGLSNTSTVSLIWLRLQLDLFPTYMKDGIVMQNFSGSLMLAQEKLFRI
jgi:hypothetical protein